MAKKPTVHSPREMEALRKLWRKVQPRIEEALHAQATPEDDRTGTELPISGPDERRH